MLWVTVYLDVFIHQTKFQIPCYFEKPEGPNYALPKLDIWTWNLLLDSHISDSQINEAAEKKFVKKKTCIIYLKILMVSSQDLSNNILNK